MPTGNNNTGFWAMLKGQINEVNKQSEAKNKDSKSNNKDKDKKDSSASTETTTSNKNKDLTSAVNAAGEIKYDGKVMSDSKGEYTDHTLFQGLKIFTAIGAGSNFGGGDGSWYSCVEQMGKWYEANIHTYQGRHGTSGSKTGRQNYQCPLINGTVQDDCSSFVRACLQLYGLACPVITTAAMQPGSPYDKLVQGAGFKYFSGNFHPEDLQPGDIVCGGPATHTEIYAGNRKSWGWGNVHDGIEGRQPMPSGFCGMDKRGGYIHMWRKI